MFPGVAPDHPCLALRTARAWAAADVWRCVDGYRDGELVGLTAGADACRAGAAFDDREPGAETTSPYGAGRAEGFKAGFAAGWAEEGC